MEERRIRVLHIVQDDKFIDGPLDCFEQDDRFDNKAVFITDKPGYEFKTVKKTSRIQILNDKKKVRDVLQSNGYDVIFFFSLNNYSIFKYIPDNKIVIWWAWGFDLYGSTLFIDIPLYKPLTENHLSKKKQFNISYLRSVISHGFIANRLRNMRREKVVRRIDYFQPVLHTEYQLMQNIKGFKAKEFYYPRAHGFRPQLDKDFSNRSGNIILGNSASYINNHVDVWERINMHVPSSSTVYIPISYGVDECAEFIENKIGTGHENVIYIKDFLPLAEYFGIVDSCTYAVFGVLRQAAMGNMYRCINNGIKLFLYKDSIPYQYFRDLGCYVYAIEDIDGSSFKTPLTKEQIVINQQCLLKDREYVEKVRESAIREIQDCLKKQYNK